MTDFSKPIETCHGESAEVLRVLDDGKKAVVLYKLDGRDDVDILNNVTSFLRNLPAPKPLRAFTRESVPKYALWRKRDESGRWRIAEQFDDYSVLISGFGWQRYDQLLELEYSRDGGATWHAAGVADE